VEWCEGVEWVYEGVLLVVGLVVSFGLLATAMRSGRQYRGGERWTVGRWMVVRSFV